MGNVSLNNCNGISTDQTCVQLPPCGSPPCASALEVAMLKEKGIIAHLDMLTELIRYHSSNADDQKVIAMLNRENTVESKKVLIPTHIDKKDFYRAQNLLNQIPGSNLENINYKDYYQVLIDLGTAQKRVGQISPAQELTIRAVANSNTDVSVNAQALLEFVRGEEIIIIPERDILDRMMLQATIKTDLDEKQEQVFLSDNYPNPYAEYTTITAKIPLLAKDVFIEVFTLVGEKIKSYELQPGENTISIKKSDLGKGIFLYGLTIEGKKIITKRMLTVD